MCSYTSLFMIGISLSHVWDSVVLGPYELFMLVLDAPIDGVDVVSMRA